VLEEVLAPDPHDPVGGQAAAEHIEDAGGVDPGL
jgi:hypothetical protein